jgi:23S rRNA (adenine2503-C2)-methyltransferase
MLPKHARYHTAPHPDQEPDIIVIPPLSVKVPTSRDRTILSIATTPQYPLQSGLFRVNSKPMSKVNLMGLTLSDLEKTMVDLGEKPFRGRQLYKWLYNNRLYDVSRMTDLSKSLREDLEEKYEVRGLEMAKHQISQDGTEKFLFRLEDGHSIETVLIPDGPRRTVCVSSQAGCALECSFCATGQMGLIRNLTVGEILGQLMFLRDMQGSDSFTNIVFMGMGEPLHNYDNMVEAIKIISDSAGLMIGAKKITISTAGIPSKIRLLADSGLKCGLAISLHAGTQGKRERVMSVVARKYPLDDLMKAIKYYTDRTGFRVNFEYIVFEGFNDTMDDVKAMARLLRGIPCKINVLAYNSVPGQKYKRPSEEKVDWFAKQLYPRLPVVTIRKSRGSDIDAACGQLAGKSNS